MNLRPFQQYFSHISSTGTPKTINLPFVPNGKLIILVVPKFGHITAQVIMCLNFGTLKNC